MANGSHGSVEELLRSPSGQYGRHRSSLDAFARSWDVAVNLTGLDPGPGRIARVALTRDVQLRRRATMQQRSQEDPTASALAEVIDQFLDDAKDLDSAAGQLLDTAASALLERDRLERMAELTPLLLRKAGERVIERAVEELDNMADVIVTDHIRPRHEAALEQLAKLAPKVRGVDTDEQAVKAGKPTAGAWAEAGQLVQQVMALRRAAESRPRLDGGSRQGTGLGFRIPGPATPGWSPRTHPTRRILDAIAERDMARAS